MAGTTIVRRSVAGASLVALTVAGLATGLNGGFASTGPPDAAVRPVSGSAAVQDRADEVFESFNGTQQERDASGVLQAWALNGAMDECMENEGFGQWDWSALRNRAPRTDGLGASVWFKHPENHAYSTAMVDTADGIEAENAARIEEPPAEQLKAIDACVDSSGPVSDSVADRAATPDGVAALREEWWDMLTQLDHKYGDVSYYQTCFAEALPPYGADALVTADTWQQRLAEQLPEDVLISKSGPARRASPQWEAFLSIEGRWETADWLCRAEVYNEHIDDVRAAIDEFAAVHAGEISQAEASWRSVEQRAAELGFAGQAGTVDVDAD